MKLFYDINRRVRQIIRSVCNEMLLCSYNDKDKLDRVSNMKFWNFSFMEGCQERENPQGKTIFRIHSKR